MISNIDELKALIAQGEGFNLEFKEEFSNKISKDICAFANSNGGQVLLGVNDDNEIVGVNITNELKSKIHDLTRNFDPSLNVEISNVESILIIDVPEGTNKPYSTNGRFYMRNGLNSQQLSRDEINDFFQNEGLILFDEKPNNDFNIDEDLIDEKFNHFLEKSNISPILEKINILDNLRLLKNGLLKNAGVLLFCDKITRFIPQATITCVLFQGKTKEKILDKKELEDDISNNFDNTIIYLKSRLNTEYIIKGGPREEKLELPEKALREAILNAIAHRDYMVTGAKISVEIYSNRVEITNPGGLVKGITEQDLGRRSLSRNNLLFGLMHRMDLVERVGSGIVRMQNAMKEYGLRYPEFDINDNWFTIIFYRPIDDWLKKCLERGFKERDIEILMEIKKNPKISIKKLSNTLKIFPSAIQKHLDKLKQKGVLKRIGSKKGGHWKIIESK